MSTIAIDKTIKDMALAQARKDMLSLSAVARILFKEYAMGKLQLGVTQHNNIDSDFELELDKALAESYNEKNISKPFSSSKSLISHLQSQ